MPCCLCEQYRWPDAPGIVWTDPQYEEKSYCVFHAPAEHKGASLTEFNDYVVTKIRHTLIYNPGEICNFTGAIFPWEIHFNRLDKTIQLPSINFSNSIFLDKVYYDSMTIVEMIFNYVKFYDDVEFFNTLIQNNVSFERSIFYHDADFMNVNFSNTSIFSYSQFIGNANFFGATFNDITQFNRTVFKKNANFTFTTFNKKASFNNAEFGTELLFRNSTLNDAVSFNYCTSPTTYLDFSGVINANNLHFYKLSMLNANFLNTDISNISFKLVEWKKNADGSRYHLPIEDNKESDHTDYLERLNLIIIFYRQMKKCCRDEQNDTEASLWHHAEKEVQLKALRASKKLSFHRLVLNVYRFISRDGEDPKQAANVLLLFLILLFAALIFEPLFNAVQPTSEHASKFARAFFQYVFFIKPDWSPSAWYDVPALVLSRLIIPIQAAILAFAIRNKLHR